LWLAHVVAMTRRIRRRVAMAGLVGVGIWMGVMKKVAMLVGKREMEALVVVGLVVVELVVVRRLGV